MLQGPGSVHPGARPGRICPSTKTTCPTRPARSAVRSTASSPGERTTGWYPLGAGVARVGVASSRPTRSQPRQPGQFDASSTTMRSR